MDVLKVFNLFVCSNNETDVTGGWFMSILFAPLGILFPSSRYSILAWFSVILFTLLIYTSTSPLLTLFNGISNLCPHLPQSNQNFLCEFNATSFGLIVFLDDQNLDFG